jgi:hypothetical protein
LPQVSTPLRRPPRSRRVAEQSRSSGTGIAEQYPAANRSLQQKLEQRGLVLSQFWPEAPPQKHNFLMCNAVKSGHGRATVIVEAGEQSRAAPAHRPEWRPSIAAQWS